MSGKVVSIKATESRADRLFRHLQRAQADGVEILTESTTEEKFATSGTMVNIVYRVSEQGCSCKGFEVHGCCKHFALYLEHVGKRPATAAEINAARTNLDRLEDLGRSGRLKSTADWRSLISARSRMSRLIATMEIAVGVEQPLGAA